MVQKLDNVLMQVVKAVRENDAANILSMIQKSPDLLDKKIDSGTTLRDFIVSRFPDLLSKLNNFSVENFTPESLSTFYSDNQKNNNKKLLQEELFAEAKDLIKTNRIDELEKLIEKSPEILSVQDKEKGNTLAIEAVVNDNIQALEVIAKKSKEEFDNKNFSKNPLDIQNNKGNTALIEVADNYSNLQDSDKMIDVLLNNGAFIDIRNKEGNNVGAVLLNHGHEDAVAKLVETFLNREIRNNYPEKPQFSILNFLEKKNNYLEKSYEETDSLSPLQLRKCNFDSLSHFYNDKNSENISLLELLHQKKSRESVASNFLLDLANLIKKPSCSIDTTSLNVEGPLFAVKTVNTSVR